MGQELGQGSGAKDFKKYICVLIVWAASHVGSWDLSLGSSQTKEPGIKPVPLAMEAQNFNH